MLHQSVYFLIYGFLSDNPSASVRYNIHFLLPVIVEYNALADHGRYEKIYNYISEEKEPVKDFKPEMLVEEIKKLYASMGIPKTLSEVGVTEDKIPQMAADAMKSGNIAANPRQTTLKDVEMLYRKAL